MERRTFLKGAATAMLTANFFPSSVFGANDRLAVGVIGPGHQGTGLMNRCLYHPDLEVVAVCDVFKPVLEKAAATVRKTRGEVDKYQDFRELIARRDIDAVVIATPDHWHPYMAVEACKAGKDVYVEKPVSVTVDEGRYMVQAARAYNRIVQVGTQQRSSTLFKNAVKIVQSGILGNVTSVETWINGDGSMNPANPPDTDPPSELDWDMWLGPAPYRNFNQNRFGMRFDEKAGKFKGWSTFRVFWDYAGGSVTDWGVHLLDIVLWAMDQKGPTEVRATGGIYCSQDNRETPDTITVSYTFPTFVCTFEHFCNGFKTLSRELDGRGREHGILFVGSNGLLFVNRYDYKAIPHSGIGNLETPKVDGELIPLQGDFEQFSSDGGDHVGNFVSCVKSRETPVSDIEIGHRSTAMCHLGNIAHRSKETVFWNPETEEMWPKVLKPYRMRNYRHPWKLTV